MNRKRKVSQLTSALAADLHQLLGGDPPTDPPTNRKKVQIAIQLLLDRVQQPVTYMY